MADSNNHRIVWWCEGSKEGTIGLGENEAEQQPILFNGPICLFVDGQENLYVADR